MTSGFVNASSVSPSPKTWVQVGGPLAFFRGSPVSGALENGRPGLQEVPELGGKPGLKRDEHRKRFFVLFRKPQFLDIVFNRLNV